MEYFEKVEKLVEKTGVSYEEAKYALDQAGGDLLDAMILLERAGKAQGPKTSTYSTQYEEQTQYISVTDQVNRDRAGRDEKENLGKKIGEIAKKVWHVLSHNYLLINRNGETIIKLPLWAALLILLAAFYIVPIVIIVSLFFGVRYRFLGEADMQAANEVMEKAANAAEKAKEEFKK
ncbi:MAG: hypothetical protein II882_04735 [Lachnospiraceae bacterium]|nr:hypothetical protein [Lachnospiraceae bacterium]